MKLWNALIKTAGGRLERVEFESPSSWRGDAIAQAKGAYGASEVVNCNPTVPYVDPSTASDVAPVKSTSSPLLLGLSDVLGNIVGYLVILTALYVMVAVPAFGIGVIVGGVVWFTVALAKTGPWN